MEMYPIIEKVCFLPVQTFSITMNSQKYAFVINDKYKLLSAVFYHSDLTSSHCKNMSR